MNKNKTLRLAIGLSIVSLAVTGFASPSMDAAYREMFDVSTRSTNAVDFPQTIGAQGNVVSGRENFGLALNSDTIDPTFALFTGPSQLAGNVTSNGKVCATCHLPQFGWGLPGSNISAHFPANDPIFDTAPESGADPLGPILLEQHGLIASRFGRFNPFLSEDDPLRQVFAWRKSQHLINVALTNGLLNDGRARNLVEQARGAVFIHTQNADERFDDIANAPNLSSQRLKDISAFEETIISPPILKALLNPNDPDYAKLIADPFMTVPVTTPQEKRGKAVFQKYCMTCHDMPNVFSNTEHRANPPLNTPLPFAHTMDIGVAQRNALHLEVRRWDPISQTRKTIVVPLVKIDGTVVQWPVKDDIGLAASTGRYEDLYRFKVPQLRNLAQLAPYFHDNSAATLEDVVDYFDSCDYNDSADGAQHPIHYKKGEREDLLAFLRVL